MATAHDHFVKAEQLAAQSYGQDTEQALYTVRLAQVHATLAHAAALGANEKPLPPVPSPSSLDPRRNQKNGTRRRTDRKSPTVASAEDSPR